MTALRQIWELPHPGSERWQVTTDDDGFVTVRGEVDVPDPGYVPVLQLAIQPIIGDTLQLQLDALQFPGVVLIKVTTKKVAFKLHGCPGITRIAINRRDIAVARLVEPATETSQSN